MNLVLFTFVLLVLFAAGVHSTAIGLTSTTLLSGSTLTACNAANVNVSGSCTGGLASVMQAVRRVESRNGTRVVPFPLMDRQTAFVQMHPLTWAVNIVAMEEVGVPYGYMTAPSLFTKTSTSDGYDWDYFYNSSLKAVCSNVDLSSDSLWFDARARYQVFEGIGLLVLVSSRFSNDIPYGPVLRSIMRLLSYNSYVETTVVYLYDNSLTAEMVLSEAEPSFVPDVIIRAGSTDAPYALNGTMVVPVSLSTSLMHVVNVTHGAPLSTRVWTESLAIAPQTGDATYYAHQSYMNDLAAAAATNDPVLGTSDAMPAHRNGNVRICLGGECPIGRMFAEGFRFEGSFDVGFTSSGSYRGSGWPAGSFRISDVWASMPFANAYCYGKVRGVTLWSVLNYSAALSTAPSPMLTSFGDRLLQLAGVRMTFNANYTYCDCWRWRC